MIPDHERFINKCIEMNKKCGVFDLAEGRQIIDILKRKYGDLKLSGHINIWDDDSICRISIDHYETLYSFVFTGGKEVYVFFDQEYSRDIVVKFDDGVSLCEVFNEMPVYDYFITNEHTDFLIAVTQYSIQGAGGAKKTFEYLSGLEHL